jgi:hypothetical protein
MIAFFRLTALARLIAPDETCMTRFLGPSSKDSAGVSRGSRPATGDHSYPVVTSRNRYDTVCQSVTSTTQIRGGAAQLFQRKRFVDPAASGNVVRQRSWLLVSVVLPQ